MLCSRNDRFRLSRGRPLFLRPVVFHLITKEKYTQKESYTSGDYPFSGRTKFPFSTNMALRMFSFRSSIGVCKRRFSQLTSQNTRTLSSVTFSKSRSPTQSHHLPTFRGSPSQLLVQQRWFWGIDVAFNKVDEERVRLAGPDRAAAEWVLRNGGAIKWTTSAKQLNDYNLLPSTNFESYKLEEIDLTATDVIDLGFEHLKDLKYLRKVILHGCRCIGDESLAHLQYVQDTLEHLEISRCSMITENGLNLLTKLKKLRYLLLYDLIEIRNFDAATGNLKKAMSWCEIDTTEPQITKTSDKH